jgi:hypothetical protein
MVRLRDEMHAQLKDVKTEVGHEEDRTMMLPHNGGVKSSISWCGLTQRVKRDSF